MGIRLHVSTATLVVSCPNNKFDMTHMMLIVRILVFYVCWGRYRGYIGGKLFSIKELTKFKD